MPPARDIKSSGKKGYKPKIKNDDVVTFTDSLLFNTTDNNKIRPADTEAKFTFKIDGKPLKDLVGDVKYNAYIKNNDDSNLGTGDTEKIKQAGEMTDSNDISFAFKFLRSGEFVAVDTDRIDNGTVNNNWDNKSTNLLKHDGTTKQKTTFRFPPKKDWGTKDVIMEKKDANSVPKLDSNGEHFNLGKESSFTHIGTKFDLSHNTTYRFKHSTVDVQEKNIGFANGEYSGITSTIDVSGKKAIIFKIPKATADSHPFFITNTDYTRGTDEIDFDTITSDDIPNNVRYYSHHPVDSSGWDNSHRYRNNSQDKDKRHLFSGYDTSLTDAIDISNASLEGIPLWDTSGLNDIIGYIHGKDISSGGNEDKKWFINRVWDKNSETDITITTGDTWNEHYLIEISGNVGTPNSGWLINDFKGGGAKNKINTYQGMYFYTIDLDLNSKIIIDLSNNKVPLELYDINENLLEITDWSTVDPGTSLIFQTDFNDINEPQTLSKTNVGKITKGGETQFKYFKNNNPAGYANKVSLLNSGYKTGHDISLGIKEATSEGTQGYSVVTGDLLDVNPDQNYYIALYVTPDMSENYQYHCSKHHGMTKNLKIVNIPEYINEFTEFRAEKSGNLQQWEDKIYFGNKDNYFKIDNPPRRYNIEIESSLKSNSLGNDFNADLETQDADGYRKLIKQQTDKMRLSFVDKKFDTGGDWDASLNKLKAPELKQFDETDIYDMGKRSKTRTRKGNMFANLFKGKTPGINRKGGTDGWGSATTGVDNKYKPKSGFIKDNTFAEVADEEFIKLFSEFSSGTNALSTSANFTSDLDDANTKGLYEILDISFEAMYSNPNNRDATVDADGMKKKYKYLDAREQFKEKFKHVAAPAVAGDVTKIDALLSNKDASFNKAFISTIKGFTEPIIQVDQSGTGTDLKTKLSAIINLDSVQNRDILPSLEFSVIDKEKFTGGGDISGKLMFTKVHESVKGLFLDLVTDPAELGLADKTADGTNATLSTDIKTRISDGADPLMFFRIDKYDADGRDASLNPIEFTLKIPNIPEGRVPKVFALPSNRDPDVANNYYDILDTGQAGEVGMSATGNEVVYMGKDGNDLAVVHVKYTGNTTLGVGSEPGQPSSTGDPYIEPLMGPRYKLPDGNFNYRLIDNHYENNRFFINCDTWMLGDNEINQMQDFVYNVVKTQYHLKDKNDAIEWVNRTPGIKMVSDACFMRKIHIHNNGETFTFDLETFKPVGTYSSNFKLSICKNEIPKTSIESYKMRISDGCIKVTTNTHNFGKVTLTLLKFNNPQIRNGFKLETSNPISKSNARGALLFSQKTSDITISSLESKELLSYPMENYDVKYLHEHFLQYYPNSDIRPKNSVERIKTY